jgi:galactokinase/mevalonate kinase-like predicted kinase
MNIFDYCIITASSERQAYNFKQLIDARVEHGLYPLEIQFMVVADPPGGRIGTGGSTLLSFHRLLEEGRESNVLKFFSEKRILIIHAGGESRRLPCFAPEGKLFTPVPVDSSSIFPPVLLDLQLNFFFKYPWRNGEVLLSSGDVLIDFEVTSLNDKRGDIFGFTKPVPIDFGSRHGVFVFSDDQHNVVDYLEKASPELLRTKALIEGTRECAIDMGLISISPLFVKALIDFSEKPISGNERIIDEFYKSKLSFNVYLELLTACIEGIQYGEFSDRIVQNTKLPKKVQRVFFDMFQPFSLNAVITSSTTFVHFGSLSEFPSACREIISKEAKPFYAQQNEEIKIEQSDAIISYNCIDNSFVARGHKLIVLENVEDSNLEKCMGDNVLIGLRDWKSHFEIPEKICLDKRSKDDRTIILVYSLFDSFSKTDRDEDITYCGIPITKWLSERGLRMSDIWEQDEEYDLLTARLFSPQFNYEFLEGYWKVPLSDQWSIQFRKADRYSLLSINEQEDILTRERERVKSRIDILRRVYSRHLGWKNISINDFKKAFSDIDDKISLKEFYGKTSDSILKIYRRTLLSSVTAVEDDDLRDLSFGIDEKNILFKTMPLKIGVKNDQIIWARSPIRLDLAGGWSDTPPHTLWFGGCVLSFAANLNGQPPIQVFCRRTAERHIRLHSIDLGKTETIDDYITLEDYRNPQSIFALPKAALCLMGFTARYSGYVKLTELLDRLGCGLEITMLCAIPKGSGLGTSSILGATILGALYRFFNMIHNKEDLFWQVLKLEQMLTRGGGWQDHIGGIIGGVKYIESKPGYKPNFLIHQLDPHLFHDREMLECFTLFYTGTTRLSYNILQDIALKAYGNTPAYIFTFNYIKQLAKNAKSAILSRDIKYLAEIIAQSWEANKKMHYSTTNNEIETLLEKTKKFYSGVKLLGAGGGGYALFLSENTSKAEALRMHLQKHFVNDRSRLVDMQLNTQGLQISVS